jgi:hypothetical protein
VVGSGVAVLIGVARVALNKKVALELRIGVFCCFSRGVEGVCGSVAACLPSLLEGTGSIPQHCRREWKEMLYPM